MEFWGEGTYRWVGWTMSSTLRTDWLTSWWNYNNQQNTNSTSSTSYTTLCMNNNFDPY